MEIGGALGEAVLVQSLLEGLVRLSMLGFHSLLGVVTELEPVLGSLEEGTSSSGVLGVGTHAHKGLNEEMGLVYEVKTNCDLPERTSRLMAFALTRGSCALMRATRATNSVRSSLPLTCAY